MAEIHEKISLIMSEIGAIEKSRTNPQQGYKFRGIDEIANALNPLLSKHKVFCVPNVLTNHREERQTRNGGILIYTIMEIEYTFYATDGSCITAKVIGEAMDSGDKSCNKAMSAAQKYAFLQIFCIPTEDPKDTELETHEVVPAVTNIPPAPTPPTRRGATKEATITNDQIMDIYDIASKGKYTNDDIKKHMVDFYKIDAIKKLPADKVEEFIAWLKEGAE